MRKIFITTFALLIAFCNAGADSDRLLNSLRPAGYVNDFAGVINSGDRAAVTQLLGELEQKTGAQIAVVTLPTLNGGQIDDFAVRLYERWSIGQKGKDNGMLLLAVINDRKVHIEVGYGFEGALPDAAAGRLIDQTVLPAFRAGDHSAGMRAGAMAMAQIAAQESGVELTGAMQTAVQEEPHPLSGWFGLLLAVVFIWLAIKHPWMLLFLLNSGGGRGGYRGGGFGSGGGFGGFGGGRSGGGGASRGW
ncbi:MAG: TPM domain-containing protein [Kiritimatiellales bacterium]